jgi:hypothetical protein
MKSGFFEAFLKVKHPNEYRVPEFVGCLMVTIKEEADIGRFYAR